MIRKHRKPIKVDPEEEFEHPPVLEPEAIATEEIRYEEQQQYQSVNSAGGEMYEEYEYVDENSYVQEKTEPNVVEFNFVDQHNVTCGICQAVVRYETLFNDHMVNHHPEYADYTLEDVPNDSYYRPYDVSGRKQRAAGNQQYTGDPHRPIRSTRSLRRVSQIRVNTSEMSLAQLEEALLKKMVEKMGRDIPVTLVDKQHAQCGICNAVLSLNRKFEVVHLVRHFNAWHPSAHKCTGDWLEKAMSYSPQDMSYSMKPLSAFDFAVIDMSVGVVDNLQCIWCGMFMDVNSIAMHFHEIHPEEVEVPNCRLCLQELVANSRFTEKFGEDLGISLPDEHHYKCRRFNVTTSSEKAMDRAIARHMKRIKGGDEVDDELAEEEEGIEEEEQVSGPEQFANSRMIFGKRNKPKRQFIMPALRQAAPTNSKFIEAIKDCHWKCKICKQDILAAVISAGAIKHYRLNHPQELESMQFELCKARLDRVSNGCMEFLGPEEIECLVCDLNYPLHRPYNICRAIRHLKLKHPEQMPEYNQTLEPAPRTRKRKLQRTVSDDIEEEEETIVDDNAEEEAALEMVE
ncbi:hypothetical protein M3Y98_00026600 [Aphelenchoides besseyi]|nr:hypothetical protein M3Y98_00026600 [Aphelenchoides besseyi]KAI6199308.1 hypothetical protein M3Y96_00613100 [Aphelenchoides besseyi]